LPAIQNQKGNSEYGSDELEKQEEKKSPLIQGKFAVFILSNISPTVSG